MDCARKLWIAACHWLDSGKGFARVIRAIAWFVWGYGLGRNEDEHAESGIGHAISLLTVLLGGTIGLGVAVHEAGTRKSGYVVLYMLAGLLPLCAMTSILRSSKKTVRITCANVWQGTSQSVEHHFNPVTVSLTRWAFLSCTILYSLSVILAFQGQFPGQHAVRLTLPEAAVLDFDPESSEKPGMIAEFAINKTVYREGVPDFVRFRVSLAPELASEWTLPGRFEACKWSSSSRKYELKHGIACPIESEKTDLKTVECLGMKPNGYYRLRVYLAAKNKNADCVAAKKMIMDEHCMTVLDDSPSCITPVASP